MKKMSFYCSLPGGTRRNQEEPGGTRRNQEEPGGTRRNQEEPSDPTVATNEPPASKGSREVDSHQSA